MGERPEPELADGEGHRAERPDRRRPHQNADDAEHDRWAATSTRSSGAAASPAKASATPVRMATNSTCRMSPSASAETIVVGMMLVRKPMIVVSCALAV